MGQKRWRQKKTIEHVSDEEFHKALTNYYKISPRPLIPFHDYIGVNYWANLPDKKGQYHHVAAKKVRMLASPYYEALYAAQQIRRKKR